MTDMFNAIENAWQDATKYPGPDIDKASFRWGFERGADYAKGLFGWHPVSELPKESGVYIVITDFYSCQTATFAKYDKDKGWCTDDIDNIEWWCYPPKEEE